eukprot:6675981-Prorocentrum_lima.AAC.1
MCNVTYCHLPVAAKRWLSSRARRHLRARPEQPPYRGENTHVTNPLGQLAGACLKKPQPLD